MGNKTSVFTDEQLDAYQDCTFFNRSEIIRIYKRYHELNPRSVSPDESGGSTTAVASHIIPQADIAKMPEFKDNPFCDRICHVFSEDGTGNLTFDNFIDMFSVFSEGAPRDLKAAYAFKIYDFDEDGSLNREDLGNTLKCLTRNALLPDEIEFISDKVLEEADLDEDGHLSYTEFEHVISRAPDFLSTFHIRI